ncbi:prenyltransferase and squalene oxidase repeat-containing protein [Cardiosporidium cionae]|uniref:Protein farnesyltransferase subunit beta n=1 Tax=Cardiosporidium cionae TaxID=476202 RepID=A0ABQ7JDS1_9APIC|nr:prenyltransferase and squalene oxidase repeat-containing protein [Cardiosporidium cionae]|eukprot:KAF8822109.1 prenyltransferase and squalene oxidase repeat-containing protein [Cardiosporidium cionae]
MLLMASRLVAPTTTVSSTPLYLFDKYYTSESLLNGEIDTSSSFIQSACEEECLEHLLVYTALDTLSSINDDIPLEEVYESTYDAKHDGIGEEYIEPVARSVETMEVVENVVQSTANSVIVASQNENLFSVPSSDSDERSGGHSVNEYNLRRIDTHSLLLHREKHAQFIKKYLKEPLKSKMVFLEASRVWCLYWILHSLNLLDNSSNPIVDEGVAYDAGNEDTSLESESCKSMPSINAQEILRDCLSCSVKMFIQSTWDPCRGGYGGGPKQVSHLGSTYAAVVSLLSEGSDESLASIDRQGIYNFLLQSRDEISGGYRMHEDGEVDMRGTYCAIATASMLHILTDELTKGVSEYIKSCQTYEGGLCGELGQEAHGGYTHCGVATLAILGNGGILDLDALLNWSTKRQMGLEGGFQGRTNKLVDSCYSYWLGGLFPLLREIFWQLNRPLPFDHNWFSSRHVQLYLLACCQSYKGGFRDRPGSGSDLYHTCYSLSGLSLAQHSASSSMTDCSLESVVGPSSNLLVATDFFYNIVTEKAKRAREYFLRIPFVEKRSNSRGMEGQGVLRFWDCSYFHEDTGFH